MKWWQKDYGGPGRPPAKCPACGHETHLGFPSCPVPTPRWIVWLGGIDTCCCSYCDATWLDEQGARTRCKVDGEALPDNGVTLSELLGIIEAVPVEQRVEESYFFVTDTGARWDGEDTSLILDKAEMVSEYDSQGGEVPFPPFRLWLHFRVVDA